MRRLLVMALCAVSLSTYADTTTSGGYVLRGPFAKGKDCPTWATNPYTCWLFSDANAHRNVLLNHDSRLVTAEGTLSGHTSAIATHTSTIASQASTLSTHSSDLSTLKATHFVTMQAETGLSAEVVVPICTGTDKLTSNGATISCAADQNSGAYPGVTTDGGNGLVVLGEITTGTAGSPSILNRTPLTVAALRALASMQAGDEMLVSDGASAGDCDVGRGSDVHVCRWTGATWASMSSGSTTGSAPSVTIANGGDVTGTAGTYVVTGSSPFLLPSTTAGDSFCFRQATGGTATITITPRTSSQLEATNGSAYCTTGYALVSPGANADALCVTAIDTSHWVSTNSHGTWTCTSATVAATPSFSPAAGAYSGTQSVAISTTTGGATICYTTDGSTPAASTPGTCSAGNTYAAPVSVAWSQTLKALATESGYTNSSVATAAYVIGTGTSFTFGKTTVGAIDSNFPSDPDTESVSLFTASSSGSCSKLTAYWTTTGGPDVHVKALVYANASGEPGALLSVGNVVTVTDAGLAGGAWVDLPFASSPAVVSGTGYFLGVVADNGITGKADVAGINFFDALAGSYTAPSNPWNTLTHSPSGNQKSIYATCTP